MNRLCRQQLNVLLRREKFLHMSFIPVVFLAHRGKPKEGRSMRILTGTAIAAFGGAAMLGLSLSPASAFPLAGPSLAQPVASVQVDKICWHCGGGWHGGWHGGWGGGWHHGWGGGWGGGWRHCWINQWGNRVCNW
jgi:hypothetical protein